MRALLITADSSLMVMFVNVLTELGIGARAGLADEEVSEELNRAQYEGIVVDFGTVSNAAVIMAAVRQSPSNKSAVLFAVATEVDHTEQALEARAHFLLRRPVETATIRQTLRAAYDLMLTERRSHFRSAVKIPVLLTRRALRISFECSTLNVSSNGIAVTSPFSLKLAEQVDIALFLPNGPAVHATGIVIWDDKHGRSGMHFHCRTPEMRQKLDSWLDLLFAASPGPRIDSSA